MKQIVIVCCAVGDKLIQQEGDKVKQIETVMLFVFQENQ